MEQYANPAEAQQVGLLLPSLTVGVFRPRRRGAVPAEMGTNRREELGWKGYQGRSCHFSCRRENGVGSLARTINLSQEWQQYIN